MFLEQINNYNFQDKINLFFILLFMIILIICFPKFLYSFILLFTLSLILIIFQVKYKDFFPKNNSWKTYIVGFFSLIFLLIIITNSREENESSSKDESNSEEIGYKNVANDAGFIKLTFPSNSKPEFLSFFVQQQKLKPKKYLRKLALYNLIKISNCKNQSQINSLILNDTLPEKDLDSFIEDNLLSIVLYDTNLDLSDSKLKDELNENIYNKINVNYNQSLLNELISTMNTDYLMTKNMKFLQKAFIIQIYENQEIDLAKKLDVLSCLILINLMDNLNLEYLSVENIDLIKNEILFSSDLLVNTLKINNTINLTDLVNKVINYYFESLYEIKSTKINDNEIISNYLKNNYFYNDNQITDFLKDLTKLKLIIKSKIC
jgi:hypothetical protein